jgi:hypothetical protein
MSSRMVGMTESKVAAAAVPSIEDLAGRLRRAISPD